MSSKIKRVVLLVGVVASAVVAHQLLGKSEPVEGRLPAESTSTVSPAEFVDPRPAEDSMATLAELAPSEGVGDVGQDRSIQPVVAASSGSSSVAVEVADGRCAVTGRVLDTNGNPLSGLTCRLGAKRRWSKEKEALEFGEFGPRRQERWVGFEAMTDATGQFVLDAPVPSAKRAELFISAGPLFSYASVVFGKGSTRAAPLEGGLRELGDLVLVPCGAASGAVVSETGDAIPKARVLLMPSDDENRIQLETDENGTFSMGHLVPGEWRLQASADGLMDSPPLEVSVAAGSELEALRLQLFSAPIVRGRVVTSDLEPVPGATVTAEPVGRPRSAKSASARTDESGDFELTLPTNLAFDLTPRHAEYRSAAAQALRIAGTQDGVTLTLKPLARVRVTAVDEASGEPLEEFGVLLVRDGGSKANAPEFGRRSEPRVRKVKGGYVEVFGRPGRDLLVVAAEGYPIRYADLAGATWVDGVTRPVVSPAQFKTPGAEDILQPISMSRGGSIKGRVTTAGAPTAATVSVTRAPVEGNLFVTLQRKGQVTEVAADSETGEFAVLDLAPGRYTVLTQSEANSLGIPPVNVRFGEVTDLGNLELVQGGTIVGQVQVNPAIDATNLFIEVVDLVGLPTAKVAADGSFRMEGVPAGLRTIRQGALRQDFIMGGNLEVNVPAGGEVQVSMDLTDFHIVPVKLQIELDGEPVPGIEVRLVDEDFWPNRLTMDFNETYEAYVGRTDAEGRLSAYGRARGRRIPVLHINSWSVIAHPTTRLDMSLGMAVDERVAFETATVTVVLPEDAKLPEHGSLRIKLVSKSEARIRSLVTIGFDDGEIEEGFGVEYDEATRGWRLGRVAPGSWTVSASIFDERIAPNRIGTGEAVFGTNEGPRAEYAGEVELLGGGNATVQLE
jgi:hypothetical protein